MKLSLKFFVLINFLFVIYFTSSCTQRKTSKEKVIGTWQMSSEFNKAPTHNFQITFFNDGTLLTKDNGEPQKNGQTYKFIHDEKSIEILEDGVFFRELEIQKLTENEFNIYLGDGNITKFVKIIE